MLDRIKALGASIKDFMVFVFTPLFAIVVGVFYLYEKNKSLRGEIEQAKIDSKVEQEKKDADVKSKESTISLDAYRAARAAYFKSRSRKP